MKGNIILAKLRQQLLTLKWPQLFQRKQVRAGAALTVILIAGIFIFGNNDAPAMLIVDGKPVAVVAGSTQVDEVINKIKAEYSKQGTTLTELKTQITYDESLVKPEDKPAADQEVYSLLKDKLDWQVDSWIITINGNPMLYLASERAAQQALEGIKQYYVPKTDGQVSIEQVGFVEDVQVAAGRGSIKAIRTPESAVEAMVKGLDKIVQHPVNNGESLWTIARDNSMTVAELRSVNPELKGDYIKPGMKLNLVKAEPLIQVSTTVTTTVDEKIPYTTIYENDATLWKGQERVKQAGTFGSRQVTYRITKSNESEVQRETLLDKLILEPISQVVIKGSKSMVASRGGGGNGILAWPTRGKINSPYGKRGREFHTGADIDGDTGDPVYTAASGVVLEVGWKGNYGKTIIIDHGNGLSTLYGHLNKINVTIGQKVNRGDFIGELGTTGRSTGSHLHFEVRINGVHQNPLRFLEK